ncbi:MAG: 50S ribosomal protein L10 [Alphaproteobacteria bacterium]|nr:50S ribosomal protein L10 [Alphaproteobacteria bacterium]MCB9696112.1 50S ribosomal protein L10 [Alphaproteobacteria bacterium]
MNREEKAQMVDELHQQFTAGGLVVLTDFRGSTVPQMDKIRRTCEPLGVYFKVVKNTLAVRALEGTGKESLADHFIGNVGLIVSGEDPIAAAKLVKTYTKDNENIKVKAGYFDGEILDEKGLLAVAELPSKEELQSMLLATIQAAPRDLLGVMQAPARDLLYLLNNYAQKLEEQG